MSERISLDEVRKVAKLARLALEDDALERLRTDLGDILAWMAALERLDTSGIEPTFQAIEARGALREDEPSPGLRHGEALRAAARSSHGGFAVPKVMEGE